MRLEDRLHSSLDSLARLINGWVWVLHLVEDGVTNKLPVLSRQQGKTLYRSLFGDPNLARVCVQLAG